ncbi:hypothetical protein GCM10010284_42070 [Streptomyces rubiginosohelvolus]|uniref:Uncharacterized protein n=1 Tax=Streptomyces rubiginosohelvolus TaxID=67362 RepID=A0ABQ3BR86_9ACTN|nr:hypothetical protein GCM10010284_42070 [Streptomyces rubiginosohelvolus]GGZ54990.1 hypothetical protein GCM10010328_32200 [Streptomyces pluricolorescens]
MQADGEPGGPGAGELLGEDRAVAEVVAAAAPVLLRDGETQQSRAPGGEPGLAGDDAVPLPLLVVREDLLGQEGPDGLAERVVLLGEDLPLHGVS